MQARVDVRHEIDQFFEQTMHVTCFPDARNDVQLPLDQMTDVMAARVNDSTAFVVLNTRIHTC